MSRIILCGASSVGKTTISSDWCGRHEGYAQITEVARDVMKERKISREGLHESLKTEEKKVYIELQGLILEEQNKRETELGDSPFISDRGPDPLAYTHLENKELAQEMSKSQAATECFARYRQSLVVLVCPLETATDDGFRMVPFREEQEQFTNTLRSLLIKFKIPYLFLGERNRELRIEILRKAVHGEVPLPVKSLIAFPCLSFYLDRANVRRANPLCPAESRVLRTILITPSEIQLRYTPMEDWRTNRVVACYGEDYFIYVKFHANLSSSLIREILRQGMQVNGDMYQFLGCSSNGLTTRECYMLKGSVDDVDKLLSQYGEFSDIKMVPEQLRGISQLLTVGTDSGVEVSNDKIIQIEETPGVLTRDGCGVIGLKLADQIAVGANVKVAYPEDNIPSVLQVMFLGYKCVVSRQPSVDSDSIYVRKSTEKFGSGTRAFQTVWVCAHSRPNSYGSLGKECIMMLSGLGVSDETLMERQEDYLTGLERMLADREWARLILDWQNRSDIAALCKSSEDLKLEKVQLPLKHVRNELVLNLERLSFPLLHSRVLFGVCDPLDVLRDGECFIRVSIDGALHTIKDQVIVGKRLCYRPGEIRRLTAVAVELDCLNHMVDCIVLKCPHSAVICDSDMGGEQYFVCWDKDIVLIREVATAKSYGFVENPPKHDVTREMLIDYFSEQENLKAKINEYFHIWADLNGTDCNECEMLGNMLSLSPTKKIEIKRNNVPPRGPLRARPDRLWNRMQAIARERRRLLIVGIVEDAIASSESARAISEGFIRTLLQEENRVVSEYCLFKLIHKWCCVQDMPESERVETLSELSDQINFCVFTVGERREAVGLGVPVDRIMNAFHKSRLVTKVMLLPLYLTPTACGWKLYLRVSGSDFDWNQLLEALTNFPESLLIIQLQDDVKLALNNVKLAFHFLGPLQEKEFGTISTGSLSTCIYSTQIRSVLRHVTECEYNIKLTEKVIQVFQNLEICDTFIFMKRRYDDKKENTQKHNIVSVDLKRFKGGVTKDHVRINKTSFSSAEIFVKIPNQIVEHVPPNSLPLHEVFQEVLEDVPSDEERNVEEDEILDTDPIRVLAPDAALKDLKEFAEIGDSLQFSRMISTQNDEVLQLIPQHKISTVFLALLSNLVVKISHRKLSEDISGHLMHILQSPLIKYQAPKDLLCLYSCLQRLHMTSIILLHIDQGLKTVTLDKATQYFECLLRWEWWTFLPLSVACQVLDKLYHKYSMLLPNASKQPDDIPTRNTIENLASNSAIPPPPIDGTHLELYRRYFAHLILKHLLAESPGVEEYEELVCTEHSICMLRAMHSQASPVSTEEVVSDEDKEAGELAEEKPDYFQVTFYRTDKFNSSNFIPGAYVKIRLLPTTHSEHSNAPIALGRITSVDCTSEGNQITVDVHGPVPDCVKRSARLNVGHWGLTTVGDVSLFKLSIWSLQRLHCSPDIAPILVSPSALPPEVQNEELGMDFRTDLLDKVLEHSSEYLENPPVKRDKCSACRNRLSFNRSQGYAIAAALNQRLTLIHGFPGAGKTVVASEIIHRMCHLYEQNGNKDFKILATAATDRAVDNLTRELLALNLFVVRVGNLNLISPDIHEHTSDQQVETKRAQSKDNTDTFKADALKQEIFKSADIISTTCAGAGNRDLRDVKFSFIVIDDATQVMEPVSLIPIVKSCQKLVLIGDPNLLPPSLPNTGSSFNSLRVTLFHRLYKKMRPLLLEEQHRMHPHIAQFPARVFYSGRMVNGVTVDANKRPPPEFKFIFTRKPVVFIHVESGEIDSPVSITNPTEADAVVQIVKTLMSLGILSLKDIAVLTPYTGQVECVKERLGYAQITNVDVSCIDDFQGKERNVVVFSTVRSNSQAELGLIGDPYRISMLLTRAKLTLIGIGNGDTLCSSQIWDEWLKRYDVINEKEFFRLTEGSDNFEKSHRSKNQYNRRHDDDDTASNYSSSSCRESEVGSEMSWYSDSEPALDSYPREGSEPPGATQGRKYPRDSELPEESNVYVTDSSNQRYEGDY